MPMKFLPVIGLEVHAELQTRSKMFCACPVVDSTQAAPNSTVCPVCAGMPGVLPVVNRQAVEYGLRVALALGCQVAPTSLFERKNYFYPDLPKGYQISQYQHPLAVNGVLHIISRDGEKAVRIRRVHLEEDTGKLTHVQDGETSFSLVDLNRAGVPLLEIVSEPDLSSLEEVRAYATGLRAVLVYLGVNSGDLSRGVMRFEANVSLRAAGAQALGTRVEIKNLNSFRAMENAIAYELQRQLALLQAGEAVRQETLGWDEAVGATFTQRTKEEAHDYRYFPEPDLPPLVVGEAWVARVRASLPELPRAKYERLQAQYGLPQALAALLAEDAQVADFFERTVSAGATLSPLDVASWVSGPLFAWMNAHAVSINQLNLLPADLAALLGFVMEETINLNSAKAVLNSMLESGRSAAEIIAAENLHQISDAGLLAQLVSQVLAEQPTEVASYLAGKQTLFNWFFGQAMRRSGGKANPEALRAVLARLLEQAGDGLQS